MQLSGIKHTTKNWWMVRIPAKLEDFFQAFLWKSDDFPGLKYPPSPHLPERGEPRCAAAAAPCGVGAVIESCCGSKEDEDVDKGGVAPATDGGIGKSFTAPAAGGGASWRSPLEGISRLPPLLVRPLLLLCWRGEPREREDLLELLDLE